MKTVKLFLLVTVFGLALTGCTKQDLNEDELQLQKSDVIYATGGQTDVDESPE